MITVRIYDEEDLIYEPYTSPVYLEFETFEKALPIITVAVEQGKAVIISQDTEE